MRAARFVDPPNEPFHPPAAGVQPIELFVKGDDVVQGGALCLHLIHRGLCRIAKRQTEHQLFMITEAQGRSNYIGHKAQRRLWARP